jgi:hypothetical protein
MANHSKPVIDKENITDEERTRLLNRQKCRNYRKDHRESYRDYQREYRAANRNRPSVLHSKWSYQIAKMEATIKRHAGRNGPGSRAYTANAKERIAKLQQALADLNYTQTNPNPSI